jgi:ABC-type oligopeptide transport system ATPase subunit
MRALAPDDGSITFHDGDGPVDVLKLRGQALTEFRRRIQFVFQDPFSSLSWGTMLYWAQNQGALVSGFPAWALAPGLAVALLGVSFALLNYAFDEISNPALRPVRRQRVKRADS